MLLNKAYGQYHKTECSLLMTLYQEKLSLLIGEWIYYTELFFSFFPLYYTYMQDFT